MIESIRLESLIQNECKIKRKKNRRNSESICSYIHIVSNMSLSNTVPICCKTWCQTFITYGWLHRSAMVRLLCHVAQVLNNFFCCLLVSSEKKTGKFLFTKRDKATTLKQNKNEIKQKTTVSHPLIHLHTY